MRDFGDFLAGGGNLSTLGGTVATKCILESSLVTFQGKPAIYPPFGVHSENSDVIAHFEDNRKWRIFWHPVINKIRKGGKSLSQSAFNVLFGPGSLAAFWPKTLDIGGLNPPGV